MKIMMIKYITPFDFVLVQPQIAEESSGKEPSLYDIIFEYYYRTNGIERGRCGILAKEYIDKWLEFFVTRDSYQGGN